jgi:DNA-binding beta-propeller fold protein YncE
MPTTGHLYIAHMGADQIVVFDTVSQAVVGIVDHLPTVTGVLAVPEVNRVYAAVAGDNQVSVIGPDTLTVIARVGNIGFPDGLAFVPETGEVYISDESGGGEVVLDTADDTVVTTIDVGGEAGNTHYDTGSGCVLVAIQSENQLLAIDPGNHEVVGRYDMHAGCKAPHGFLIDAPARQAFVSCEDSATLLVVNLTTMQVMGAFPTGEGPDVLAFDPGWGRLYVASESGIVSIFDAQDETLRPVGEYKAPRAHSIEVAPSTHLVYLPLEDVDGHPVLRILTPLPPGT